MFVGIVGSSCSGKHEVMNQLASLYGFTRLYLQLSTSTLSSTSSNISQPRNGYTRPQKQDQKRDQKQEDKEFSSIEAMLDHVTLNWMQHFVTCDVQTVQGIAILRKRPFFLLLSVESPMMMRYHRCVARTQAQGKDAPTLEEFVEATDTALYSTPTTATTPTASRSLSVFPIRSLDSEQDVTPLPSLEDTVDQSRSLLSSPNPDSIMSPSLFHSHSFYTSPPYKLLSMSDLSLLNNHSDLVSLQQSLISLDITNPDLLRPSWDSYFMYLANLAARRSNCCAIKIVQVGVSQVVYSESYGMDDLTAEVFRKAKVELRQHATPGIKLDQSSP
ncbi:Deoxycytidine monophosphate (dCMP) deaminase [Gamsiella multidivaricata]|nr:Deoxycytidine monophosphate (dCMP) deaminase [Gamsiella multidivaricata]